MSNDGSVTAASRFSTRGQFKLMCLVAWGTSVTRVALRHFHSTQRRSPMKKILVAAAVTLMCGSAFAQTATGPAAQSDDTSKPGMTSGTTDKGAMHKGSGTTGM